MMFKDPMSNVDIETASYFINMGLQSNPALYDGSHQVWADDHLNLIINGDASYILGKILDEKSIDMVYTCPAPLGFYRNIVEEHRKKQRFVGVQTDLYDYITRLIGIMGAPCYRVLKETGHVWIDLPDLYDYEMGTYLGVPETFYLTMIYGGFDEGVRTAYKKPGLIWFAADKPLWHRAYDKTVAMPVLKKRMKRDWENVHHFTKVRHEDSYWNEEKKAWWGKTSILSAPIDYEKEESKNVESGYPEKLIEIAIELSCPPGGTVLDPMAGTGTVGKVAQRMGRKFIMVDLSFRQSSNMATKAFKGFTEIGAKSNL